MDVLEIIVASTATQLQNNQIVTAHPTPAASRRQFHRRKRDLGSRPPTRRAHSALVHRETCPTARPGLLRDLRTRVRGSPSYFLRRPRVGVRSALHPTET